MKGRISGRASTKVMLTPSAANMHAYSQPITPPPKIVIEFGKSWIVRISSLSWIQSSAKSMSAGRRGLEPVLISTKSPLIRRSPSLDVMDTVCASTKRPWPKK